MMEQKITLPYYTQLEYKRKTSAIKAEVLIPNINVDLN